MKVFRKRLNRTLSLFLTASMLCGTTLTGVSAVSEDTGGEPFQPSVTYQTQVTDQEREAIHKAVDALSGYVGDMVVGDGTYDENTLIGGLATGSSYDSISHGSGAAGTIPTEYPFAVPNTESNRNEGDRKSAKFDWVIQLAENLGFDVV